jgi:hypothetical protein
MPFSVEPPAGGGTRSAHWPTCRPPSTRTIAPLV